MNAMPLTPLLAAQLERLRAQLRSARPEWKGSNDAVTRLPIERYTAAAVRDAEIERLFRPLPLIVGHASELGRGQVMANDDYDVPLLLTRDADGRFAAFLNVCRHRGMRLVDEPGTARSRGSVVCPYHGWTYRLDGVLRHRLHADAFDAHCGADAENLVPLACEERHGLLWVVPTADAAIDVAAHLDRLDAELPFFGVDRLVHFRTIRTDHAANWKLMVDAFLEAYHIRVLHKDTIDPFFADGITTADRLGPHIQSLVARRVGETWATEHAAPGSGLPAGMAELCEIATPTQVIFPNTITIFHPDYLSLITLYPVAAGSLRWMHRMLIPADRATADWAPHWEKTFDLIERGVFAKEDIGCAVAIQRGFASGANRFLTAGRAEQALGWFHADVDSQLAAAPAQRVRSALAIAQVQG